MSVRWWIVALGLLSGATPAFAFDAPPEVRACMAEENDARRLACYDKQLGRHPRGTPDTSDTDRVSHQDKSAARVAPQQEEFGMSPELARKQRQAQGVVEPKPANRVSAHVTSVAYRATGEAVVTLDNGQTWQQAETDRLPTLNVGDTVDIKRGTLGAFWMSVGNSPVSRVKRVR